MAEGGEDFRYADEESSGEEESHKDRRGIKDEISTSGGEGIHYADKGSSGEEESHKDRRGIKDEISTSGDKGSFNIGKAWETLKFQIYINKTHCEYEATKQVDMCKLQFVLGSDIEKIIFLRRLTKDIKFEVLSAGVVEVSGDFAKKKKIEAVWSTLIMSVNDALDGQVVESHRFQSRRELENILQELDARIKNLIVKGIVGIFTSYEDTTCITKFVGPQKDIETLNKGLYHAMANKKRSCTGKSDVYDISIDISLDEGIYFETMKLNEQFLEKFPHVRLEKEENNSRAYKFTCSDENDLVGAINWFKGSMNKMSRFELDFSSKRFINISESVQFYLQKCLHKVPADLIILPDKMYILCCKSNLQSSEQIVADSIKAVEIEGSLFPEVEKIQKDSRGKIQIFIGNKPGMIIIWYTVDKSAEAKELENLVKKYKKCKKKPYSDKEIKAMKALDVIKELQEEYKDILIRTGDADVILQGPEMDGLDAFFEKLDTVVQQIKFVALNLFSELQQKLLKNGKVQKYVTEKLQRKISFCEDGEKITYIFKMENEKSKSSICMEIKNCFVEMIIDTQCLEHGKGKSFLSEHPEEVVIGDQGNTAFCSICYTANLSQGIEHLLYSYSKSCTPIVANYLLSFGAKCLEEIKEKHKVGIEIENDRICVKGQYNRGKNVVTEIESHLNTTVLHFGKLDYKRKQLLAADKNQIDSVAENCRCCLKAEVFPFESTQTEENGIGYLCTWHLPCRKEQISIAKIDYNTAKLDRLIIPVNESLYGEDIFGNGERCYSTVQSQQFGLKIGDSKEIILKTKYVRTKCFALVTSESGLPENKQTRQYIYARDLRKFWCDIFAEMFHKGPYKVGFALPTGDPNLIGKLDAIIEGFQDITQLNDMSDFELIFGVKTEAERWMQEIDYISTLKLAPYVRRNISPRYKGLLSSPSLRVQIQKKSILETGAHCIVVAISWDLDLSRGIVSKLVSDACGEQLQEELHSKDKKCLDPWELVMCRSYNLSKKGIQKVIFGFIPVWKDCQEIEDLEVFIEDCLLLADSAGCSTVAFPALGTGKLEYPYRDVAVALFNGVDKYVDEGMIGAISTVYISVPPENEVSMDQILEKEELRRKSFKTSSGKQHQANGQEYLVAENGSVKYSIITESDCERMTSVKFVNVKFEAGNKSCGTTMQLWEINIKCRETKEGLVSGVKDVVRHCEDKKITCVNIFCSDGFKKISMTDQVDTIIQSVEKEVRLLDSTKYKYLKNVRIVVSDAAFSTLYELKGRDENASSKGFLSSLFKSFYTKVSQSPLNWKILSCHLPKKRHCLNIALAGCKHSDIERAKVEITQYIEIIEYCDPDKMTVKVEKNRHLTSEYKSGLKSKFMKDAKQNQITKVNDDGIDMTQEKGDTEIKIEGGKKTSQTPETEGEKKTQLILEAEGEKKTPLTPETEGEKKTPLTLETEGEKKTSQTPETESEKKTPITLETEGEEKTPLTPETEGEKKTPLTSETEGEKKTPQTPETEGEKKTSLTSQTEGEKKTPQTLRFEGEKKTPLTPETKGEKKTPQTPETEGVEEINYDLNVIKMDKDDRENEDIAGARGNSSPLFSSSSRPDENETGDCAGDYVRLKDAIHANEDATPVYVNIAGQDDAVRSDEQMAKETSLISDTAGSLPPTDDQQIAGQHGASGQAGEGICLTKFNEELEKKKKENITHNIDNHLGKGIESTKLDEILHTAEKDHDGHVKIEKVKYKDTTPGNHLTATVLGPLLKDDLQDCLYTQWTLETCTLTLVESKPYLPSADVVLVPVYGNAKSGLLQGYRKKIDVPIPQSYITRKKFTATIESFVCRYLSDEACISVHIESSPIDVWSGYKYVKQILDSLIEWKKKSMGSRKDIVLCCCNKVVYHKCLESCQELLCSKGMYETVLSINKEEKEDMKEKNLTIPVMRFGSKPEQNMKSWLMEQAATSMRKPEKYVSLKGDELLGKFINELHSGLKGDSVKLTKRPLVQQSASTRPVKMGPKPTSNGDNTFKVKGLHKPVIKTEPMDETPQIKEYDSQPSPVVGDEKENTEDNFEGTCLTKDQKDSFKFDGRLIQLTEIQIEALGKSLYEKAIGEGAFGQVYSSKLFGIPVAVKKIQTNTSPQNEKHARMEMMANRLMNPFILPLIAFAKKSNGICRETWYITPYCENGDLKKAIEDGKARKDKKINLPGIRVRIALQVALAIQYIHTEVPNVRGSILHKDIASSNVVLDKNLNARLIDFGLAREKNDTSNTNSERPGYIHPLEGHGDPVKESLDYYNFGIIILELLTSLGPLGEKQLHLKNMDENQIQNKLDTNVWIDKEITKKLYALSKKCLEEFKWTIEEFETNVIKALQDIMRTEAVDIHVYECQEETCHHCIINPIAKQSSLTDDHYANCTQKIKVCIACEKNSILNPVICYCGARLISMIGSKWGALLVAGDDESPDKAAVMKREILELERVVTSKAPRIIGISKCNVKTVVPCDTKKETKKEETWTKIQKHIADFAKNEDIDTLLIYISCHGDNGKDKESSERNMFRLGKSSEYISLVAFEEQLETLNKIDKLIIFLDRCFPPMVEFKDRNRDFVQINACSEGEKAILKDEGSLFTTYVIQGLKARSEKRECSKDCEHCFSYWNKRTEYISIDSLFDYVNKHLKQKAPTSKRHLKGTLYDIAFFTEEMVHIEFTSKDKTIRLQLEYLKNIDEVKGMLLKEFEVDTETHMVKIEKDIFRNDQEADDECKTLEQVMEAWVNRFPLLVSFLKKEDT